VLGKVDAKQSTSMKQAIDHKWHELVQARPKPYIFWEFIEEERNRFLKNMFWGFDFSLRKEDMLPSTTPSTVRLAWSNCHPLGAKST
jgi:hypothetical protein